jgi:hypothetical protein
MHMRCVREAHFVAVRQFSVLWSTVRVSNCADCSECVRTVRHLDRVAVGTAAPVRAMKAYGGAKVQLKAL